MNTQLIQPRADWIPGSHYPDPFAAEIAALPPDRLLASSGGLAVYLAHAREIPALLRETGRLREITFRAAGEGTGQEIDLDRFDAHYQHLILWDAVRGRIAGGYRLCPTDCGAGGLYTATLFQYSQQFLDQLGPAVELGRSFLCVEYQRTYSALLLLWNGIGRFIARNPRYKVLFGAVSISNDYSAGAREAIVSYLEKYAWWCELASLVRARHPVPHRQSPAPLEQHAPGMPVLLRHYLKLGGRLLGFNLDPDFSDVIDGLIVVDLTRTEPRLLERYLGKDEAAQFMRHHDTLTGATLS